MEQLEFRFTSADLKTASQPGIYWAPEPATPEQVKEWDQTDRKFWGDNAIKTVVFATIIQFTMMGFMLLTFKLIDMGVG
jgi:hypothetical protein|tara:strand:+ start:24258 stop:24494 length:237 start_codon:yes stop_codon:yes gene_type:complete